MPNFKLIFFGAVCIVLAIDLHGQTFEGGPISMEPAEARQDFRIFRDSLFHLHPCIDRYNSEERIEYLFDSCYSTLTDKISTVGLYRTFKFLLSTIQDGHLSISPTAELGSHFDTAARIFPLSLYFTTDKAFVRCDDTGQIPTGSELLSLNDVPLDDIEKRLFSYIVSDGSIESRKRWILNRYFWFYYYLVYGGFKHFDVRYKEKGTVLDASIEAGAFRKTSCLQPSPPAVKYLDLSFNGDVAVLSVKSFSQQDFDQSKEDFKGFLKSAFLDIKKRNIRCLIIDVRHNGGGRDVYGSLLYSYLTKEPFSYYASLATKTRQLTAQEHPNLALQKPSDNGFYGKVVFLIDGLTFSTAAEFCAIAKSNHRGIFIGEETGGGYYGNNSGDFRVVMLPHSKFTMYVPTTKYTMAVRPLPYTDRGIQPDIEILPAIGDVIHRRDVQLSSALHWAMKSHDH